MTQKKVESIKPPLTPPLEEGKENTPIIDTQEEGKENTPIIDTQEEGKENTPQSTPIEEGNTEGVAPAQIAAAWLKQNEKVNIVFATSDGNLFLEKQYATKHAFTLADTSVLEFTPPLTADKEEELK